MLFTITGESDLLDVVESDYAVTSLTLSSSIVDNTDYEFALFEAGDTDTAQVLSTGPVVEGLAFGRFDTAVIDVFDTRGAEQVPVSLNGSPTGDDATATLPVRSLHLTTQRYDHKTFPARSLATLIRGAAHASLAPLTFGGPLRNSVLTQN